MAAGVNVIKNNLCSQTRSRVVSILSSLLAAGLPWSASASINASLTWTASPDTNVTGYNLYYGGVIQQYTNSVSVGNVTHAVISNLLENTTYFFAAKAHNSNGDESDFSNEAAFAGYATTPDGTLRFKAMPTNAASATLTFSLGVGAPAGATINPTNGLFCWTPGRAYASTTNYINVIVADTANPAVSISETLQITVSDYLEFRLGQIAVSAGSTNSLPLTIASSSSVTNVQLILNWPANNLVNPTLTFAPPVIAGSLQNQGGQLVIQLQTTADQPLTGTNQIAQVNFKSVCGQPSAIFPIPATAATGTAAAGSTFANVIVQSGEVVVVGSNPLLRPKTDASGARTLSLFANPGNYQLQYTTSLVPPVTWTPLIRHQQSNIAEDVSLDSAAPIIFYRLQQL